MLLGRLIGWLFIALSVIALGWEIVDSIDNGGWQITALGKLWFDIHPGSLGLAQVVVQRYVLPAIWDPVVITVLQWPAWAMFGVPGILFAWVFRRRRSDR
jgi:hypothetical protein